MLRHASSNTMRSLRCRSAQTVEKMRSPLYSVLLLGIVGLLLVSREVGAQSPAPAPASAPPSGGGKGHFATSLCAELIISSEYNCIEYEVVTDDGFMLGLQNIPSGRGFGSAPSNGPPVLLQHGLTAGGDNWVANGPTESLAFILADAGFDVWITNTRAIQWSHGHKIYNPSQDAYWAWTYDELASYDLKASTEFVFNKRGGRKLSYIGHSLGTTILIAGLTDGRFNTTVLGFLNAAVLLAPILISTHLSAPLLRAGVLAASSPAVYAAGAKEYSTYASAQVLCGPPAVNIDPIACYKGFTASIGTTTYTNVSRLGFYSQYFPQPSSTYNFNHLGQGLVKGNFAFYDKGPQDNQDFYGQPTPPNYDITTFPSTLPVQCWSGGKDQVADPTDVATILALLPNRKREDHMLPDYGHTDFILGYKAYIDIYPQIISFLNKYV